MSCNLKQALVKVEELLKFPAIQKNTPFEIKRIKFEIEAMMAAKKRMLEGPTDETYTTEKVEIDHGTDYTKLITSLENRVKDYAKYVTKDTKNINVHRSIKDANGQTKYLTFGNPFSRYTTGEVDDSILSAMFYRWVVNNEVPASFLSEESTDTIAKRLGGINSARRKIIDELKSIAGKELYYEGTARGKNLSHASTLALIADLYGKGSLTINSNARQNVLTKSTTNKVGQSTENKQASSIDATPMRLPYGASNDNNSKTSRPTPEFDTLPEYVPGQKNMTYAGIGSRETPTEVLELMTKASTWLGARGYTLQSGGAIGADMAFEGKAYPKTLTAGSYDVVNKKGKVVLKAGEVVKIGSKKYTDAYYAFTDKSTKGSIVGSDWSEKVNLPKVKSFSSFDVVNNKFGNANKVKVIANELHPSSEGMNQWAEALMARNTYQIFGSNLDTPVDFVLFYAKEGKGIRPDGGTGQAVEMARLKGIPTVNMADNNWRVKLQEVLSNKNSPDKKEVTDTPLKETTPNKNLDTLPSSKLDDEDEKYRLIEEENLNAEYTNDNMFTVEDDISVTSLKNNQILVSSKSGDGIYTISEESKLKNSIGKLLYEAEDNESKEYLVTDLGTKYTDEELVDMIFKVNGEMSDGAIPDNVKLPAKWKDIYYSKVAKDLGVTIKGLKPIKDKKIQKTEVGKSGIEGLKSQQEEAAVKMINMLNSETDNIFMLEGEAGTGKSYTVSKVLAQYMQNPNHSEVITVAAATAHKAKDVIGDMIDEVLQSVDDNPDRRVKRVVDLRLPSILSDTESRKVVVLDEVSMVSPETMADIKRALDRAASEGVRHKVIMLGDRAQLRPVINIMNANNIIAYKNNYTGHYVFKKNAYDLGIDGSFDGKNFIPNDRYRTDAVLPAKLNPDGSLTIDASSMLLKSFLFRDLGNTPNKLKHKLDEQQRNTTATFEAIRKFRTDRIETSTDAENTKSYNEQLNDAIKGLTKAGAVLLSNSNSRVPKKVMNDIRDGKGVFLSYTNDKVDTANTLFTNIFARETGVKENIESAETYGVFAGQRVFSVSNIYADTSKVTNNTQGTVVKLEDISDVNSSIIVYDSDRVYNIAKDIYSYMWNFGSNKPIEPKVSVWLNTDDLIADKVNVLKAVGINIETEEDGQQYLVDIVLNNTSRNAIVKYVKNNKEEFSKYDSMILEKNEDGRALTAFLLKYGNITMEVTTKDIDETLTVSIGEMLGSSIKDKYPKKVYAKDVVELFKGIAAPYAQTVHKSQGSTFNSVISDNSTNYYQSTVNKLETLYVAYSRSRGDIVIAPNILDNLSGYKTSETESALDEYLTPDLTPEASTKSEDSIISDKAPDTEHKVTIDEIMRCLNLHKG